MPGAIWSGTLAFGLVSVPVKVVSATKSRDVRFHQLEVGTGARIRHRRVSEATGEEIPNERIVKGYELTPGRYVVVDVDEMRALAPKAGHSIEIVDFVELDRIDPVYFEQPYYLVPDPSALKPYRLLVETMVRLRRVAIGRVVIRSKEHLVAVRPLDGVLCMETMRYDDEVLQTDGVLPDADAPEPTERELAMAEQLVESLSVDFDPTRYRDEYREKILALIDAKAAGEEIVAEPAPRETGELVDLTSALEASLARIGQPTPSVTPDADRPDDDRPDDDRPDDDREELPPAAEHRTRRPA